MEPIAFSFDQPLFLLGALPVTAGHLVTAAALLMALASLLFARRASSARAGERDEQMATLLAAQTELQGRIAAMADVFGTRQAELNQSISQRIDGMTHGSAPRSASRRRRPTRTFGACRNGLP